ncbi:phage tail spike protein [Clostridium saudiense]|uniref:phage tail spike protein n=1 Tax=Clostridium saudiense TaxID=1414720 RepID=UPI0004ACCDDC|nr:phage tail spike protein [Clostridium saudiense]
MLCIYDKKTIKGNFDNNGLGVLNEPILAEVTEELNGQYYLEFEYPANSKKSLYFKEFNIIKADNQLFRIYKVEKVQDTDKRVKVYANHIFYDMDYYFIEDKRVENAPIKTAMEKALVNDLDKIYTVDSDVVKAETLYMIEISPVQAFFKMIERWEQGELLRDNFTVKILRQVGNDSGVLIKYGKNIQGLKITVDTANVVTKIYPKGANGIKLSEKYINVPNWDSELYPPFPIIRKVEFKDAQDEVTLRSLTTELATTIGLSTINIQIDFIELSKIREYENYKKLEMVNIGDIVTVKHSDFDIDVKVKVIKIKKDILTGLNTKVELGQPLDDFVTSIDPTKIIKTVTDDLGNQVAQALTSMLYYANSQSLQINTTSKQFIYIGVGAIANTNLTLLLAIYGVAEEECTITIKIQLDNNDITFTPKVKLQQGDNTIGIPLGIPQVSEGAHYIGVFLSTDSGVFNIPIWNLQLMIDGRNLQGGLSAEPPHAEVKEYQCYINTTPWLEKSKDMFISINSNEEIINNSVIEVLNSNYILSNIDKSSTTIKENIIIDLVEI